MVEPVNVVAGGNLNREIDIHALSSELSNTTGVTTHFTDENQWQLVIGFDDGGKILLYRTGSYIIRGGSDLDTLEKTKKHWFDLIKKNQIVEDLSIVDYSIQNIVFTGDLDQQIDLAVLAVQLGINNTEYEPEQFPGLIYRPEDYSAVMLVFTSGKVVITGSTEREEAESLMIHVKEQISQI